MPLRYSNPERGLWDDSIKEAIRTLEDCCGRDDAPPPRCASPVFLLSAGWRCGSTLLQRLLCSDKRILVWGEPFGDLLPVHRLAQSVACVRSGDPHAKYSIERHEGELSGSWIANLNPGFGRLRLAHRTFFEELFAAPAAERGYARWGCKWTRLTAWHAYYLRWLYPEAKFVFLVRHPLDAYASYFGRRWYLVRPSEAVAGPSEFFRHWNLTAGSFLREGAELRALLVRYEDIVSSGELIEKLAERLGLQLDRSVLKTRVGASKNKAAVKLWWRLLCKLQAGEVCGALGYDPLGGTRKAWAWE